MIFQLMDTAALWKDEGWQNLRECNRWVYYLYKMPNDTDLWLRSYEDAVWKASRARQSTTCLNHNYQPNEAGDYICTKCHGFSVLAKLGLA